MADANGFVRRQARTLLLERIRERLPSGVEVFRNEPRTFTDECVYLAVTIGNVDYPAMGANLPRDDRFTVLVVCQAHSPGDEAEEAEERVESYANAVMDAVAANPVAYNPFDGDADGLVQVTLGTVNGPNPLPAAEGYGAVMTVAVDFHTRIVLS